MYQSSNMAIAILLGILSYIIMGIVLYFLIRGANDTNKRNEIQLQNQALLSLIAEQLGVDVEKINKVINNDGV